MPAQRIPSFAAAAVFGALAVSPCQAQTQSVVLPVGMETTEGQHVSEAPFGTAESRMQVLIDPSTLAPNTALIQELRFRREGLGNATFPVTRIEPLQVFVGTGAKVPGAMSKDFASNVQGSLRKVFDGVLDLPSQAPTSPAPFAIQVRFSAPHVHAVSMGPLLIEMRATQKGTKPYSYLVDAHYRGLTGGDYRQFGTQGSFSTGDRWGLIGNNAAELRPGGQIDIGAMTFKSGYASLFLLGFSATQAGPIKLPLDLTALGAPGNSLYVSPDFAMPMTLRPALVGWIGQAKLPIPNDPRLDGFNAYVQTMHLQQSANALGLVFSRGMELQIRKQQAATMQCLWASKLAATSGTIRAPEHGGPVIRFGGLFQ